MMCGFVGIISATEVAPLLSYALMAIQHRGQDAAGVITYDGRFHVKKSPGLAVSLFSDGYEHLPGSVGIAHTRYPTIGGGGIEDAQPFFTTTPFGLALAHNGNIVNYEELKTELSLRRRVLNSECDAELLLAILSEEIDRNSKECFSFDSLCEAVQSLFKRVNGSYSAVAIIAGEGLCVFRDPLGIKPASLGKRSDGTYIAASETVALDILGCEKIGDVAPGEVVFVDRNLNIFRKRLIEKPHRLCIFEFIYFARPDSVMDGISVYEARLRLGEYLAEQVKRFKLRPDVVIPVPDTARAAAVSLSSSLGVPHREGLIKNRYIGRTFIMPSEAKRRESVRMKLNPIRREIEGKKVLLVDDSIVRGNTSRAIVELTRSAGAKEVFFAVTAPPLRHPCVYGIDMQTRSEFIARQKTEEEIRRIIGADALIYQKLDDLVAAIKSLRPTIGFCTACFNGDYPTPVSEAVLKQIEAQRQRYQLQLPGT
ncbi:MAG: amidophosphoribosyltransferase [Planctomycetota bacterium]|nr:amidophosphoribosyltransferase [Planctomycetota bacterium]